MRVGAVLVQELHPPHLGADRAELLAGPEGPVDHVAVAGAAQLGAHERAALAGLDVLELDDLEDRAVDVDVVAVAKLVGAEHHGGEASVRPPSRCRGAVRDRRLRRTISRRADLGQRGEDLAAVLGDHHQVLDPDPELARQVDAGLDGDDVAGAQLVLGALRQPRRLVDLEADAVTETVAELLAVAGGVDHRAGDGVDLAAAGPGPDGLEAGQLGLAARARRPRGPRSPGSPVATVRVQSEQ